MSLFLPSIPQPSDNLDFSQGQLLSNNQGLDTVFGVDHYKFSDATSNKGFHNTVSTPIYVANPPTGVAPVTTTNPILYGFQDSANIGVIQYSRGPTNAVPSPITKLQSSAAAIVLANNATLTVLNFTGITRAIAILYAVDYETITTIPFPSFGSIVKWNGSTIISSDFGSTLSGFQTFSSGTNLIIRNVTGSNMTQIFWTLDFMRLQ